MFFRDRIDAGEKLVQKLLFYKELPEVVVVGLPRGGVPVAYQIAEALNLPLDITCPRKIGAPFNHEYAIGAITETGERIFNEVAIARHHIPAEYIEKEVKKELKVAQERLIKYRGDMPLREFNEKTVILVDDGLATGLTMKAAIHSMKKMGVKKIVMAIPVASPDALQEINSLVESSICLQTPSYFEAVGQFYHDFRPTTDDEVIELLKIAGEEK